MTRSSTARSLERVAVALDTADWATFESWCELFGPRVGVLKVGLEAFLRWGARAVEVANRSPADVFLDLKLHDIPNTVAGAVSSVRELGVRYLTVHASGGSAMLGAATEAAGGDIELLAVTLLTHLGPEDLAELDLPGRALQRAERWATLAQAAGCGGAVCSALEVARLRELLPPPFRLVTPGIRSQSREDDDQRRTASPAAALAAGSDLLVIGRPLTAAEDPVAALDRLAAEISEPG